MSRRPVAIALTKPIKLPSCEAAVGEAAARYSHRDVCGCFAKFRINGKALCGRHAGAAALAILLEESR